MVEHPIAPRVLAAPMHTHEHEDEYTNVNYVILGEIVEKESGEDLGTYVTRNILEPLGMENTIYPLENDLPGDLHGYHADIASGELKDTTILNPAPLGGSGAMISDISDLKTWAEAVCTGKLLEPETHRALPTGNRPRPRWAEGPSSGGPSDARGWPG